MMSKPQATLATVAGANTRMLFSKGTEEIMVKKCPSGPSNIRQVAKIVDYPKIWDTGKKLGINKSPGDK